MLIRLLLLCLAGSAGTLARFGVYEACVKWLGKSWEQGWQLAAATLTVNVVGSFLFGIIATLFVQGRVSEQTRWLLLAGFMGAFTTFSSFAFDTGVLIQRGQYLGAALNVLANNVLGIGAFFAGLWIAGMATRAA